MLETGSVGDSARDQALNEKPAAPELIFGLVTPIGTDTGEIADALVAGLDRWNYEAFIIKLSEHLPSEPVRIGEREDERVRRLIRAGNAFCEVHNAEDPKGDPAALARLAIRQIQRVRVALFRQDGNRAPVDQLKSGRKRTAYILQSLKRPAEVQLLRSVYGEQFILLGSQSHLDQRIQTLLKRPMTVTDDREKLSLVRELIRQDADERASMGQRVNETYPQADFFMDGFDERVTDLIFGQPIPPTVAEFAMYVARASSARSLAASRKVGAALVVGGAVVATGYNDVPPGQVPDVLEGKDTSEGFKRDNVADTMRRLRDAGLLSDSVRALDDEDLTDLVMPGLKGGQLLSVIEYQRAVHAEAKTLDDAAIRGVIPVDGQLYVTTYPCHLCYKHALSVQVASVHYIEPYPKSRASVMYPSGSSDRLLPYEGVAPRRYAQLFEERLPFVSDPSGIFPDQDRSAAAPLLWRVRNDEDRHAEERLAIGGLREEYQ